MEDHIRTRLQNLSVATSTDDRYICYAFDGMVNLGCRSDDTRVILHRGLSSSKDGIRANRGEGAQLFNSDSVDSRPVVNKLGAAFADSDAHYFATFSVNQLGHFGVSPIKQWIDSQELQDILLSKLPHGRNGTSIAELKGSIARATAVVLLRNWMETAEIWMDYITRSPEKPLGNIWRIWWRHEYQDTMGNLSHIHALIWLHPNSEPVKVTMDRIRGMTMDLVRAEEMEEFINMGLLESYQEGNKTP